MGWCSATEYFDDGLNTFLEYVPDEKKFEAVEEWYRSFSLSDWDCQEESQYYNQYLHHIMLKENGLSEYTTVLRINRSESICSYCGLGAFPDENGHYSAAGYGATGKPCGQKWEAVSSDYKGMPEKMVLGGFPYRNLNGLPVFTYNGEYLGGYNGTKTRENEKVSEVSSEEDFSIYESE